MIAADPRMQKLPLWKLLYPVRALAPGPGSDVENRIAATEAFVEAIRQRNPALYAAHPMLALEPDEEYFAMEISFLAHINTSSFHTPSYEAWLDAQDFDNWYVWLKKLLQYAQYTDRCSGKALGAQGAASPRVSAAAAGAFPRRHRRALPPRPGRSSCVVLRDAARLADGDQSSRPPRGYRTIRAAHLFPAYAGLSARSSRGGDAPTIFSTCRTRTSCATHPPSSVNATPRRASRSTQTRTQAMQEWETSNRQHKHGQHRYALADFGIAEAEVAGVFAAYSARFAQYLQ